MNSEPEIIQRVLDGAVAKIEKHVASCVVIVTAVDATGATRVLSATSGNAFAQEGSVDYWLRKTKALDFMNVVNEQRPTDPPDDAEAWKGESE